MPDLGECIFGGDVGAGVVSLPGPTIFLATPEREGYVGGTLCVIRTPANRREEQEMRTHKEVKQLVADRYGRFAETGGNQESC